MPGDLVPPRPGQKSSAFERLSPTPKDVPEGIRTPKRQHSSRFDISDQRQRELVKHPGFHEVPPNRRQELFMQKIDQCNIIFDFNDASGDMKSKEIKRLALHELLDYVANNRQVITDAMYPKVVDMFSKNLFRPIPPPMNPQGEAFDPEEDEPVLEVAWPHIQVVYEFFLRFIESQDFNTNVAKGYIDHQFVLQVRLTQALLLPGHSQVPSCWSYSIQKILGNVTFSKPPFIAYMESSWIYGRTSGDRSTMYFFNSFTKQKDSTVLQNFWRSLGRSSMGLPFHWKKNTSYSLQGYWYHCIRLRVWACIILSLRIVSFNSWKRMQLLRKRLVLLQLSKLSLTNITGRPRPLEVLAKSK